MKQKTHTTKAKEIKREWHLVDLKDQVLGRISTNIAVKLIGKNKQYFTQHLDCGDYIVAINAGNIRVTGRKKKQKMYYRHSGFPGGFKQIPFDKMMQKDPRKVIELAVRGMLPKNKLRDKRMRRLKVFNQELHPYKDKFKNRQQVKEKSQKPKKLN